ncbi:mitochondrial amidoxime-reducing component 1-like isoform X3 [Cydia pomonella]|uniref:mitochondrial amidoxime-reducing component 1-like isoform X3 n=1 Tax=Cydia pomonella TaxID=82600 RepID=UPI002ADE90CF|nr:mitochondrial amidoxime-reducing component 1-like isoform X3 [Cydia pomonella]
MSSYAPYTTAAAVTAGVLGSAYCAYHIYQRSKPRIPTEWTQVGTLQKIYTYPIKSCGPVVLETGECSTLGLKDGWLRDRVLMVIDEKDNFITARAYPEMLLVSPCVRSSVLTLTHKHDKQIPPVHVNLAEVIALQKPIEAKVWAVPVPVFDCGKEVSEWFNNLLGRPSSTFRLVYYATQQPRLLRSSTNRIYKFTKNDTGALPDETPFNLINEASVDDLNTRLQLTDRVSHRSFRPNFILQGALPYAEDNWKFLKIGNVVFEILKPCTRCVLTTIDPETGVRNPNTEPLETLKSYRQIEDPEVRRSAGNSPRMGLQLTLRSAPGQWVTLDDPIYVA